MRLANGSTTLFEQSRIFDPASNVTSATTTLSGQTDTQGFCYEELNRLTWAGTDASGSYGAPSGCSLPVTPGTSLTSAGYQFGFSYDSLGRRTSIIDPKTRGGSYYYSDPGHLHGATNLGGLWLAYDPAGNQTCRYSGSLTAGGCGGISGSPAQLSYDTEGRLANWQNAASSPIATDAFLYDNQGNRVAQQAVQNGTTTTTVYVGNLEQVATSGSTTTTQTFYNANGMRIAMAVNGAFYYLAGDALGSVNVAVRASDSSVSSHLYGPYGNLRYSSGTMPTDLGFGGQHADSVTGLDYFNARYYDPITGQFASPDRILPGGGMDVLGLSRYAYTEGNPETLTDPSGMNPCFVDNACPPKNPPASSTTPALPPSPASPPPDSASGDSFTTSGGDNSWRPELPCGGLAIGICHPIRIGILNPECFGVEGLLCAGYDLTNDDITGLLDNWESRLNQAAKESQAARAAQAAERQTAQGLDAATADIAYHYTFRDLVASIQRNGLRPGSYVTLNGSLSPLQAQIDLALPPNRGLTNSVLTINLAGLRKAGYDVPRVTRAGRNFNMPGGEFEMQFPYEVPPEFISLIGQ